MTSKIANTIATKPWVAFFKSVLWLSWLSWLLCADLATAADDQAWQRGQALYRNGWNGQAACIRCHGSLGEGREEGGLRAPAIAGRSDRLPILRAMLEGVGSNGQVLHPLMPRYQFDAASLDDLLAYLNVIGKDTPGVSESVLRIGVMLPPTAYGTAIQAGLNTAFDQVVYGRQLQLLINPPPGEVLVEVANLQATHKTDLSNNTNNARYTTNAGSGTPVIGPLPLPGTVNFSDTVSPGSFHLLASMREQARALLTQVALDYPGGKAAQQIKLIYGADYDAGHDPALQLLLAELREQAGLLHQSLREQVWPARPARKSIQGEVVIFLGSATHLPDLLEAGGNGLIYASAIHLGPASLRLTPAQAGRLRLLLPWRTRSSSFDLATAYGDAAYASGLVLVEALKRCGRQLGRADLLQQLENLRDFPVPDFGKISFRPDLHHGSHAGQLLAVDVYHGVFRVLRTWQ
ncbi:hypothetical protein H8L32_06640 [Undibacterium sp. CY18W]|uniref:Cytochrome c domain-containing protein n=1 Tax=Undibacterium hunanense TaxID=2762292 RepID=A0ABR6ZML7_9BURK|nr:hypothetical protein [Undibacterium hunanense]MBC3917146.1 hypothetical protein [Undibacterium hunanense]